MRYFKDSDFIKVARLEISEQVGTCKQDIINLGKLIANADPSRLDEHGADILNEVSMGVGQVKALYEGANEMLGAIENFLITGEFPTSAEMKESIKNTGADITSLEELDEYKLLISDEEQERFAFVVCNYELISRMLDSAMELCAVLHKAAKRL